MSDDPEGHEARPEPSLATDSAAPWERMGRAERIAAGASLAWVLLAGGAMAIGGQPLVGPVLVVVVPVALLWMGLFASHASRTAREESHRLRAEIQTLQRSLRTQSRGGLSPEIDRRLATIERAARQTETALAGFGVSRPVEPDPEPEQPEEAPAPPPAPALGRAEMARALNFPDNDQDLEGFAALRAALRDTRARQLIQASQDVLTLLSQDGIYMDDLAPPAVPTEAWRALARGERGAVLAPLSEGLDADGFAGVAAERMAADTIFRDTAQHFLRLYDRMLDEYCDGAEDEEIALLAETRTGRAFRLLGAAAGNFA
ncbi:hypothetical protein [Limimaricola hongkongensis]|uniref:Uncharacterized protein n=1 Tax=Limimaricola hongkongensis DSM 17492 TaxID=1122180 RepID=A0A017HCN7_9RHOB|nr:hypothetical protein [Limimaricola hongkongensis]EYD72040.1 hypothetical protein Lokhon_02112 [Limimaricola hongkongensis DSM 17492]